MSKIELVIFDWAGTTVDYGCFAPVSAFIETFARNKVEVSIAQAREPMGLHKKDHIRALLQMPSIAEQWQREQGQPWSEADVEKLYEQVTPLQVVEARKHTDLIPGLLNCVAALRDREIKIASTTGYPRPVADPVIRAAEKQGYIPDHNVCADEVPAGRPEPWMIHKNMEALDVSSPQMVVKVGDTVPDIEAGRNAGVWTVGVTQTGSEVGCTEADFTALGEDAQNVKLVAAESKLRAAGAHEIIRDLTELPEVISKFERQLADGGKP